MNIGFLTLHLRLEGCRSLKEKRGRIKPLLTRLRREFNVSVAEIDFQDIWQDAMLGCVLISNEPAHTHFIVAKVAELHHLSYEDTAAATAANAARLFAWRA